MSFRFDGGRQRPQPITTLPPQEPIRLDEARLRAWALAIDEQPRHPGQQRRPHRSMLPDVDFSLAVPAPRRPGFIARLFRRLAGRPAGTVASAETAGNDAALGEAEQKSYVWVIASESKDAGSPAGAARSNN